jgi:hypothetical protein
MMVGKKKKLFKAFTTSSSIYHKVLKCMHRRIVSSKLRIRKIKRKDIADFCLPVQKNKDAIELIILATRYFKIRLQEFRLRSPRQGKWRGAKIWTFFAFHLCEV